MTIGERIKKIRTEKGLSTYALSEMAGVSQSAVSKLENGKRKADNIILMKLAEALNISIDRLTGDSVSSIIENRLDELNTTLEEVSKKANVPHGWLKNIDFFIPGDMEFMLLEQDGSPGRALDWDEEIDCSYKSYEWISRVAEVLNLPPGMLRAALARQEVPLPENSDLVHVTAHEAFGSPQEEPTSINTDESNLIQPNAKERSVIKKYRSLDTIGQEHVDFVLNWETDRVQQLRDKDFLISELKTSKSTVIEFQPHLEVNAAHARTDIAPTPEDQSHDDAIMNDDSEWE